MKNYRFTGPPPPTSARSTDPVVSELREIQNTLLAIMRKADFAGDYEAALVAAAQAAANAQLIGAITERLEAPAIAKTSGQAAPADAPVYIVALNDGTLGAATAYWKDGAMLHYMTPEGSHVQVRLNLVDRELSTRLNRVKHPQFGLPD
jgi:hypothetical protein